MANRLEALLQAAATNPVERPAFIRCLLESEVFVLGQSGQPDGRHTLEAGTKVAIRHWSRQDGTSFIPFFTSVEALQQAIKEQEHFLGLRAKSLFEMTKGADLVLNPGLQYAKEFLPEEVAGLLEHDGPAFERRVVTQPTQVLLAQPKEKPERMLAALSELLPRYPEVKAAYLALMHDASRDPGPTLVVGIEGDGNLDRAVADAGHLAADTRPDERPVDFVRITPRDTGGIARFMLDTVTPFYRRDAGPPSGIGPRLRAWMGRG